MTIYKYKNDLPNDVYFGSSIAIDTETMGLNVIRDRLCLIQISAGDGNAHLVQFEQDKYDAPNLKKLLNNKEILKIFHFARFDLASIQHYLKIEIDNIYCTKIASKLVRTYSDAHGLKSLCEELLGIDLSKKQQTSDWGNFEISEKQIEYAASDVLYLHQLREKLILMLNRENRMKVAESLFQFLPIRIELDLEGFGDESKPDIFAHK